MPDNKNLVILIVILVIISAISGFWVGQAKLYQAQNSSKILPKSNPLDNPLFDRKIATFKGEIVAVNGNKIQFKNDLGKTGELTLAPGVIISSAGKVTATVSASPSSIEVGKRVFVETTLVNGEYQISAISYIVTKPFQSPKK